MMKRIPLLLCGLLAAMTIGATVYAIKLRGENARLSGAQQAMREFCIKTKWAVQEDLKWLQSSDPRLQRAAVDRFYDPQVMYHNGESFLMCLEQLPEMRPLCTANDLDVECRITAAKELERALAARYPM